MSALIKVFSVVIIVTILQRLGAAEYWPNACGDLFVWKARS